MGTVGTVGVGEDVAAGTVSVVGDSLGDMMGARRGSAGEEAVVRTSGSGVEHMEESFGKVRLR